MHQLIQTCYCGNHGLTSKEDEDLPQHGGQTFCFAACIALYMERSKSDQHFAEDAA
jgi:prenyltransferase beta subunit